MKHKRLRLSVVILLGLGITGLQAQTMYVTQNSGTQTAYELNNIRKMTFTSGNVNVQKTDNTIGVYALSDLKYLSFQDFTVGINEQQMAASNTLLAYPNPVADMLTIDLTGTNNRESRISILNLEGKELLSQKTSGMDMVTLNLSKLPHGVYLCRYTNGTEIKTVKIIKK